ncbi:RHS repeat-associated core domain-containing protein [Pseudomonas peradeniyensis]|uniref:RHS repeat-associated core domain-containing protein n=1 Tax=Pseudomonas peradeniyensis TaxID=2745488 RepID=UPI003C6E6098
MATDSQRSVFYSALGANSSRRCYAPYGYDPIPDNETTLSSFTGALRERHTGSYLLGNGTRGYSPVLMRFLSADSWSPFGEGGVNAYAYCGGDPVNQVDPTAHASAQARRSWWGRPSAEERGRLTLGPTTEEPGDQMLMLLTHFETANQARHADTGTDVPGNTRQQVENAPPQRPLRVSRLIEESRLEIGATRRQPQQINRSRHLTRDGHIRNNADAPRNTLIDRARDLPLRIREHEDQASDTPR